MPLRPLSSTLFPYTTLFRSIGLADVTRAVELDGVVTVVGDGDVPVAAPDDAFGALSTGGTGGAGGASSTRGTSGAGRAGGAGGTGSAGLTGRTRRTGRDCVTRGGR